MSLKVKDWGEAKLIRLDTELYQEFTAAYKHYGFNDFSKSIRHLIRKMIICYHKERGVNIYELEPELRSQLYGRPGPRISPADLYAVTNNR